MHKTVGWLGLELEQPDFYSVFISINTFSSPVIGLIVLTLLKFDNKTSLDFLILPAHTQYRWKSVSNMSSLIQIESRKNKTNIDWKSVQYLVGVEHLSLSEPSWSNLLGKTQKMDFLMFCFSEIFWFFRIISRD